MCLCLSLSQPLSPEKYPFTGKKLPKEYIKKTRGKGKSSSERGEKSILEKGKEGEKKENFNFFRGKERRKFRISEAFDEDGPQEFLPRVFFRQKRNIFQTSFFENRKKVFL